VEVMLQLMIPMVFSDHEVDLIIPVISRAIAEVCAANDVQGNDIGIVLGACIGVPRACMRADKIAATSGLAFMSIDSATLTQMMFGMSKVDSQSFMVYMSRCYI
jgi:phosphoenolpyruvate-protein kinase (PTS system EI component)